MTDLADDTEYTNRCGCGWVVTGPLIVVVDATIDHGRRIHNMEATREQVLAVVLTPGTPAEGHDAATDLSA
jgi:hypothetical protein